MPVKIRLQRHGKKASAFFHIVIADGRAPRDGKFIEKIGTYNPTTNPATIELDSEKALTWLQNGAQPTDTCRAILSYKGLMYKNHLQGGVAKGALTQEQADAKLAKWIGEKETKINAKVSKLATGQQDSYKKRLAAEVAAKEAKAAKIIAKNTPPAPVVEAEAAAPAPDAEAPQTEA
jgi:small subunit ribosomal protein S16